MNYENCTQDNATPPLSLKKAELIPPQYTKTHAGPDKGRVSKVAPDDFGLSNAPWLLRRTSIQVSSEPAEPFDNDRGSVSQSSTATTKRSSEKDGGLRKKLFKQTYGQGHSRNSESISDGGTSSSWQRSEAFETGFGTQVSIEAGQPQRKDAQRQYDMKGLEQAASIKRWAGGGKPGEAWGKLQRDPELWDPSSDTLVYYSYQRPEASFRVHSAMLEEIGSDILTGKLHEGLRRGAQLPSPTQGVEGDLGNMRINDNRPSQPRANTGTVSIASVASADAQEAPVRYQIHFPAPDGASRQELLRYHLTTRNFFALLLSRPLVGLTFYQALIDLYQRLQLYLPGDPNCALIIIKCLMENNLHNVCNDPAAAAGLLAWSEDEEICWQEGWREGFVHCSGMYAHLRSMPEFRDVSHTSRTLLERTHLELQVRIQETEDRLCTFDFNDIWPENSQHYRTTRTSLDHIRKFLREYYQKAYKYWPPRAAREGDDVWLTRAIVTRLQTDFDRLYDYFVNQDIVWTSLKYPDEHSLGLVCSKSNPSGGVGDDNFLAECIKRFDQKHKNTPIPHPYPLLPSTISSDDPVKQHKPSLFSSKSKALEKRAALAYSEASNIPKLQKASDFAANGLVDAFIKFEHNDNPSEAEPRAARKGRWMMIYGVLQVLSKVSVDIPDLYFAGDVGYFLNPRLKGTPPWSYGSAQGQVYEEAHCKLAHCWRDLPV